ncbi:hypothetical protein ACJJTC_010250 [Scirpophaga incertulas]
MTVKSYFSLLFLISFISLTLTVSDEVFFDEDKPYDVVNIRVAAELWKQAMQKAPILKSPVTVVVPIHIPEDEGNETENEVVAEENTLTSVVTQAPPVQITTIPPAAAVTVSAAPINQSVNGSFFRYPCSCVGGQCGCCTGAILERYQTKVCGNISFVPEDFIFDVRLSINENTVVRRRVSASNPPPICFNPRRAPFVEVCAEISNIRIRNRNAFACLDINADIGGFPIYSASFRCFGLGASGLQTGLKPKPASSGPAPISLFGNNNDDDEGGGFIDDAAGAVFGTSVGQLFGGDSEDGDDGGPFDAIGDAFGDLFEKR